MKPLDQPAGGAKKTVQYIDASQAGTSIDRLPTRRDFLETTLATTLLASGACMANAEQAAATGNATPTKSFEIAYHLNPEPRHGPILDWLAEGGWCSRISCVPDVTDEMLAEIRKRAWAVTVTMWAHPETRARQWTDSYKRPVPDAEGVVNRYKQQFGERFAWEIFTEDDSAGIAFPQVLLREGPKTYEAARQLFDEYLAEAMTVANQHRGIERWGRPGYASGAHAFAAPGIDCLLIERTNDDVEDLQTAVAFARGASRQFGCRWGIDFSLWWGVIFGCVQDLPALYHKRNFYLTYFSGADLISVEGGDLLYDLHSNKPHLLGQTLDEFGRFARCTGRGKVSPPVAVLLPDAHGWLTPPYWRTSREAWNYARIPYQQGYRGVDAFFAMAFPGSQNAMDPFPFGSYQSDETPASPFALSCVTPEYAPSPDDVYAAEPPIPFGRYADRHQAREDLKSRMVETSPYRPMGSTRWGDVLDVLTASASEEALSHYKAVVLLGPIRLDSSLKTRLSSFVRNGGTLVLAAGVAGPGDSDLCGIEIVPELRAGAAWRWVDESFQHESFRYCPASTLPGAGVSVLAEGVNGCPLIVRHKLKQGQVYTCAVPWFEGASALTGAAVRMFDELIDGLQPVKVDGLPIHWTVSRTDTETIVALANDSDIEWKGWIHLRNAGIPSVSCRELLTGLTVQIYGGSENTRCEVAVPPYDVRVFCIAE